MCALSRLLLFPVVVDPSVLSRARISYYICFKKHRKCLCNIFSYFLLPSVLPLFYYRKRERDKQNTINQSQQIQSLLLLPTKLNLLALLNIQWWPTNNPNQTKKNVFISIQVTQLVGKFWAMLKINRLQWL